MTADEWTTLVSNARSSDRIAIARSAETFNQAIATECEDGFSFVPLVGAGVSAPSGVPIIRELGGYLKKCIAMALGLNQPGTWRKGFEQGSLQYHECRRWLPGRDEWPPFGDPQIYARDPVKWEERLADVLSEIRIRRRHVNWAKRSVTNDPTLRGRDAYIEYDVFQEAFGAMAEWRSALMFLSRLKAREGADELALGSQDPDIIDTFFLNVMLGKRPTLGHRILARLAGPLRINTLLTTNFDDLLEQAFAEAGNPLTPFDVHVDSGLPPFRDLLGKNSVVKLHGGRYGLRADYSLDSPPTDHDSRHFVEYLADQQISEVVWEDVRGAAQTQKGLSTRKHLLVIGCSANDERIFRLLKVAKSTLDGLRIFWICYSDDEAASARNRLRKLAGNVDDATRDSSGTPDRPDVLILRHQFVGLLLLQLFQELTRSLPPTGALFPTTPRLPVPPKWRRDFEERDTGEIQRKRIDLENRIGSVLDNCFRDERRWNRRQRTVLLHGARHDHFGATSVAASVFERQLEYGRQCAWIDLDEVASTDDLFEILIHTVARKAGIVDWHPVLIQKEDVTAQASNADSLQVHEVARLTNNPDREWVIFLNGRSIAGINLEPHLAQIEGPDQESPNGWLDSTVTRTDGTDTGSKLLELLRRLTGRSCPNIAVLLLTYDGPFLKLYERKMTGSPRPIRIDEDVVSPLGNTDRLIAQTMQWIHSTPKKPECADESDLDRARFLFAMCLASSPRYQAMLWSRTFHQEGIPTGCRVDRTARWLQELSDEYHVLRFKHGGFVWMHCDIRNRLRNAIESEQKFADLAPHIHDGLCEWYRRLLLASDDPAAAFEAIYHRCRHIYLLIRDRWQLSEVVAGLAEVRQILEIARPFMLSAGFTRGLYRRLDHLRSSLLNSIRNRMKERNISDQTVEYLIDLIECDTFKLNRAIAREVSENPTAFKWHRELRIHQVRRLGHTVDSKLVHSPELADGDKEQSANAARARAAERRKLRDPDVCREALIDWVEAENELGTLGIAVRSYDFSYRCFDRVYRRLGFAAVIFEQAPKFVHAACPAWLHTYLPHSSPNQRYQMVAGLLKTLQRHMQLELARGQLVHLIERRSGVEGRAASHFACACRCYSWGVQTIRHFHSELERAGAEQSGQQEFVRRDELHVWLDDRQRLDTQHALALAFLGDFKKAHRRLNEAESAVIRSNAGRQSLELAVIELHRAESLTLQAVFKTSAVGAMTPLAKMRHQILSVHLRESAGEGEKALGRFVEECRSDLRPRSDYRSSLAFVDDAWQTLDRAERLLDRHRKNVWWTAWYFDLRMKLVELRIFASLAIRRTVDTTVIGGGQASGAGRAVPMDLLHPIPHVSLESAAYGAPTLVDRLLDSGERMVRLDIFRMAKIVESYAHILLGLTLWRVFSRNSEVAKREAEVLAIRQRSMILRLTGIEGVRTTVRPAVLQLEDRFRERKSFDHTWRRRGKDDQCRPSSTELTDGVEQFYHHVQQEAKLISRLAQEGLWEFETFDPLP